MATGVIAASKPSKDAKVPPRVPTKTQALKVIGGQTALDDLHNEAVKAAKSTSGNRLQLAMAITRRHFACDSSDDLDAPATAAMSINDRTHIAFELNSEDGPWAVAMSGNAYAWATVSADDLAGLKVVLDFLNCVFAHLR